MFMPLVKTAPLIIGGVEVPYHTGFIAHSDGDVALHALTDAFIRCSSIR